MTRATLNGCTTGRPSSRGRQQPHSPSLDWGLDGRTTGRAATRSRRQTSAISSNIFQLQNDHIIQDKRQFFTPLKKPTPISASNTRSPGLQHREARPAPGRKSPRYHAASPLHLAGGTPFPENNLVNAPGSLPRGRAVVLYPLNADAISYNACAGLNWMALQSCACPCLSRHSPPAEIDRPHCVSANIGRTLDSRRQGVIDVRCCLDWLESQGCNRLGIVARAWIVLCVYRHRARPADQVAAFNHASTYFADVVWHGQSTRHIREG